MKNDFFFCTKILYFLEKIVEKKYFELPDIDDVFAIQFDMTIEEIEEIYTQLECEKVLFWDDLPVEIEDSFGNAKAEITYDALLLDSEKGKRLIKKIKEKNNLAKNPFIPREAIVAISNQIYLFLEKEKIAKIISSFSHPNCAVYAFAKKEYTLTDILFRHAYANAWTTPFTEAISSFLSPLFFSKKEETEELFTYIDKIMSLFTNKKDYHRWVKGAEKYIEINKLKENFSPEEKNTENNLALSIPCGTMWEDIKIEFQNKFEVKIYIKENFHKTINNIDLDFYRKKTKDKNPTTGWKFLETLSVTQSSQENTATVENISYSLGVSMENCHKIKSNLSKTLKKIFGIEEDPFLSYKDIGYYKTKFELLPISTLRGNGEVYIPPRDDFNDNQDFKRNGEEDNEWEAM